MNEELRDEVAGVLGADPARFWGVTIGVVPERVPEFWADVADALMPLLERREREAAARAWDEALRWVRQQAGVTSPEYVLDRIDRAEPFNPYRADAITSADATTEEAE